MVSVLIVADHDTERHEELADLRSCLHALAAQDVDGQNSPSIWAMLLMPPEGRGSGNVRNGSTSKTVQTAHGDLPLQVPRDRQGSFEPLLVPKRQRRLEGFDEKVLALYARGLRTRDIQGHLEELYDVEVSPTLISTITDAALEDVRTWQSRPLEAVYPILYFDCLFVKSRQEGVVKNKGVYVALGVNLQGEKELLGLWISETEGAKF